MRQCVPARMLPATAEGGRLAWLAAVCALLLAACAGPVAAPRSIGAWVVYWDLERGLDEFARHAALFDRVSLFAYELDSAGKVVPAPGVEQARGRFLQISRQAGVSAWATVVNDVREGSGRTRLKDSTLLLALLQDPVRRTDHARELAARVARDGYAGLDLDYERLPVESEPVVRAFVGELSQELSSRGLGLNVVLEPARGPSPGPGAAALTVMAYNEHGPHGNAGPRATPRFVAASRSRASGDRAGEPGVAIALGGFLWPGNGEVRPLDWADAARLARSAPDGTQRSRFSSVPYVRLADGSEAWFEDARSLEAKWRAARAAGYRHLMLWRLGGNDEALYGWLADLRATSRESRP